MRKDRQASQAVRSLGRGQATSVDVGSNVPRSIGDVPVAGTVIMNSSISEPRIRNVHAHWASCGNVPVSLFANRVCESCPDEFKFAVIVAGTYVVGPFVMRFVNRKVISPEAGVPSALVNVCVTV